ncbi:unnamed protein product, partial [Prorocentrum cordatum]
GYFGKGTGFPGLPGRAGSGWHPLVPGIQYGVGACAGAVYSKNWKCGAWGCAKKLRGQPSAWLGDAAQQLFDLNNGLPGSSAWDAKAMGVGAATAGLSAQECETMAALHDKLGEGKQSVQVRLKQAHLEMRGVIKKLESALVKHEALERQLAEQKTVVLELRSERIMAEAEHNSLVQCLLESQELPKDEQPLSPCKLTITVSR